MGNEPLSDLANAKLSLGDGFGDEFVGRDSFQFEIVAVGAEKGIGRGEANSPVAIEECVIVLRVTP